MRWPSWQLALDERYHKSWQVLLQIAYACKGFGQHFRQHADCLPVSVRELVIPPSKSPARSHDLGGIVRSRQHLRTFRVTFTPRHQVHTSAVLPLRFDPARTFEISCAELDHALGRSDSSCQNSCWVAS